MDWKPGFEPAVAVFVLLLFLLSGCAFVSIPLVQYTRPLQEKTVQGAGRDKVVLVDVSGMITGRKDGLLPSLTEEPDIISRIREELDKAAGDKRVRGLVLRINSPGGTVTSSDILHREIVTFKKKRDVPVVACLMDVATSGAYYIACAADRIVAHPTTVTGSIGVIVLKFNLSGLMDMIGVRDESIKSGARKDILSPFRGITPEEQQIMQDIIDSMHSRFVQIVADGRKNLSAEDVRALADGRIFDAEAARENNLVDAVGYLDDVVRRVEKLAGLEKSRVVMYHRPMAYRSNIYSQANVNILGLGLGEGGLKSLLPVQFMYLWGM